MSWLSLDVVGINQDGLVNDPKSWIPHGPGKGEMNYSRNGKCPILSGQRDDEIYRGRRIKATVLERLDGSIC
jgi:hypothetical protein